MRKINDGITGKSRILSEIKTDDLCSLVLNLRPFHALFIERGLISIFLNFLASI
jgi:hypothetical protein